MGVSMTSFYSLLLLHWLIVKSSSQLNDVKAYFTQGVNRHCIRLLQQKCRQLCGIYELLSFTLSPCNNRQTRDGPTIQLTALAASFCHDLSLHFGQSDIKRTHMTVAAIELVSVSATEPG